MTQWFVPPIVIPAAIIAFVAALALYRYFVAPERQSGRWRQTNIGIVADDRNRTKKVGNGNT